MHLESNAFQLGSDFIHLWFISEVITVNASDSCLMAKSTLHLPGASFHLLWCVTVNETKRCPYYLVFFWKLYLYHHFEKNQNHTSHSITWMLHMFIFYRRFYRHLQKWNSFFPIFPVIIPLDLKTIILIHKPMNIFIPYRGHFPEEISAKSFFLLKKLLSENHVNQPSLPY